MGRRRSIAAGFVLLSAMLLAAACTGTADTRPAPSAQAPVPLWVWLGRHPATIAIAADPAVPDPTFGATHLETDFLGGAARGAAEGARATTRLFTHGGCGGQACAAYFVLALALMGAGAVIGAGVGLVTAGPEVVTVSMPLSELAGAETLFAGARAPPTIHEAIRDQLAEALRAGTEHVIVVVPEAETAPSKLRQRGVDALFTVTITAMGLSGEDGDDPPVALVLAARLTARRVAGEDGEVGEDGEDGVRTRAWTYTGEAERLGHWIANGAAPFRAEVRRAVETLAGDMARDLFAARNGG